MTQKTTTKILDAAGKLFSQRGYVATTTRAIAQLAGVNEVTIFRHFGNKAGILRALGQRIAARQKPDPTDETGPSGDARDRLLELAQSEIQNALSDGGLVIRLAFDARSVPEVAEILGQAATANLAKLAGLIATWQTEGKLRSDIAPHILAQAFFSLTSSYVMHRMLVSDQEPDTDRTEEARQLFEVFWNGVVAPNHKEDRQ